jgi:4-amino-4-deoxy-L-arabinose transferase-like glycosyltransferase
VNRNPGGFVILKLEDREAATLVLRSSPHRRNMGTTTQDISPPVLSAPAAARPWASATHVLQMLFVVFLWVLIFAASLASPPLFDDADATHAQAAQAMLSTGDWVTLHVDGVRYLEKAPLPYWIAAVSLRLFGNTSFAIHLPLALTVLGIALLGYAWSRQAFNQTAAFYAAVFTLTSAGVFLFTRIFIPDALLSLLLACALYAFLRSLEPAAPRAAAYLMWTALALAVLTKGLVALVFFFGAAIVYLIWTGDRRSLHRLKPVSGILLLLAIAAPWHILAGLRNTNGGGGHGFFWFYFVNEHFLRFLGERIPRDYNKLPAALYWSLHLVWLFPWSLFAPAALLIAWRKYRDLQRLRDLNAYGEPLSRFELVSQRREARVNPFASSFASRSVLLLCIFSALVLIFFSLSTNQEYYTFPTYLPLLMLLAAALSKFSTAQQDRTAQRALTISFAAFAIVGYTITFALVYGLWSARHLAYVPDIGAVLAHRGVGDYTLSMSHFFDLTGPSFAALRLPSAIAAFAFSIGPAISWFLHARRRPQAAFLAVAATSAAFLIASHIALIRFSPMLSSHNFATTIQTLERNQAISPDSELLLFGDQAYGSSIAFYLQHHVLLVDGRSTSMLFGSTFPDASAIFLTHDQLLAQWGTGPRKILFVPLEERSTVDQLLGSHEIILKETSGKALITDRALDTPQ